MDVQTLYEKALRSYLLRKYTPAATTCLRAIAASEPHDQSSLLKVNIWTLYLNIASTLLEHTPFLGINIKSLGIDHAPSEQELCRAIWNKVTHEGFGSVSDTDARIVSSCLVMYLKLDQLGVARDAAEAWFAALSDEFLDHIAANQDQDQIALGYISVVDLYITRILPGMEDFESAKTFVQYNSVLNEAKKKGLLANLQDQQTLVENERQQKKKLEEAAKLAAEEKQKEIERRQLEEAAYLKQEQEKTSKEQEEQQEEVVLEQEPEQERQPLPAVSSSRSMISTTKKIQDWIHQITTKGMTTSGVVLVLLFALFALLRGQRGRFSAALQAFLNKLWQTVKMGTKVTYM
ncbi:uncharacterized protein B0P05DRAFT_555383 [Gilbertella persicaria]|uniref:uncharacterized protein n=1 Tax=Gilbertella persicaria TaxID=101096 RepID=UPI0022207A81|nr:uncharacterized protein B0P05DRAFT_555383 [Gilbertella persicaria]KAI8063709.1 hypothetical protein B0P05DRAFT_555383 [Gilbertella persicaria]